VKNSTVAFNSAGTSTGGGIHNAGILTIESTLVVNNSAATGPDVNGAVTAYYSLIGSSAGATITGTMNKLDVDPLLAALADNGGPTKTHALLAGSPAINAGNNPAGLTTDQRGPGFPRVIGGQADIGAFEVQPAGLPGDYNQNNVVDAADYVLWRKTLGTTGVPAFSGADGDGDTIIDQDDYNVWRQNFGNTLPPGTGRGDSQAPSVEIQNVSADEVTAANIAADDIRDPVAQIPAEAIPTSAKVFRRIAR
jgi:hypothetical protein